MRTINLVFLVLLSACGDGATPPMDSGRRASLLERKPKSRLARERITFESALANDSISAPQSLRS